MPRPRSCTFRYTTVALAAVALAAVAVVSLGVRASAQSTAPQSSADTAVKVTDSTANAATASAHHSRFGRWGRSLGHAASKVGKATGIDKGTAERIAITAVTGGAGAALMNTKAASTVPGVAGLATGLEHQSAAILVPSASNGSPKAVAAAQQPASLGTAQGDNAQALAADQDLAQISMRAAQGDSASRRAMQALNAAMAHPDATLASLQHRAAGGDANASRDLILYEDRIARAALTGSGQ